jgi:hypothetical protein
MRNASLAIRCFFLLFSLSAGAQLEIVEIEQPQLVKSLKGVVNDPTGAAIPGVVVEERSADWKEVLRSTETDDKGRFQFRKTENKAVYYIEFSRSGFDFLRVTIHLERNGKPSLVVKLPIAT